jgi:hypothetical protein
VTGIPQPDVTWYFNDQLIVPGTGADTDKYRVKRDSDAVCLYVRDCKPSDSGRYKCRASNCDGEASCEAGLEVVDKMWVHKLLCVVISLVRRKFGENLKIILVF